MATLNITRLYADGEVLFEADLDEVISDVETFLNVTKLNDDNIQDDGITASSKFLAGSVTGDLIATSAITTSKIAAGAVGTDALGTGAITTAKIATATLDGAPFADNSVTVAKLTRPSSRFGASGIDGTTSSLTEVTLGTASITATGNRQVLVAVAASPTVDECSFGIQQTFAASGVQTSEATLYLYEDTTVIGTFNFKMRPNRGTATSTQYNFTFPPAIISALHSPTAGAKNYYLKGKVSNASTVLSYKATFFAIELV